MFNTEPWLRVWTVIELMDYARPVWLTVRGKNYYNVILFYHHQWEAIYYNVILFYHHQWAAEFQVARVCKAAYVVGKRDPAPTDRAAVDGGFWECFRQGRLS